MCWKCSNFISPTQLHIRRWLLHFCRLHNSWTLHLIEKENIRGGKIDELDRFVFWASAGMNDTFHRRTNIIRASLWRYIDSLLSSNQSTFNGTWKITQRKGKRRTFLTIWDSFVYVKKEIMSSEAAEISLKMINWCCLLRSSEFLCDKETHVCDTFPPGR